MGINIRQKGAEGEREVIRMLGPIVKQVLVDLEYPAEIVSKAFEVIQRNQNQSAVGGCDLNNVFGIAIEVKRQETLQLTTWWNQTVTSAERNNELPLLIYRKNRQQWKVRTYGFLHTPSVEGGWSSVRAIVDIEVDVFKTWFYEWVKAKLLSGWELRI